ncbi:MAG: hypothetical protein Q7R83_00560 [bacterium]|nr:hypothetical protein [bacterium]
MEGAARWSIHLCSWHDGQHVLDFLSSVDQQAEKNVQVVIVDHAQTQGVTEQIRSGRRDMVVLRNAFDRGFVRSHEQAITFALSRWSVDVMDDRYILITHPDVLLEPHLLARFEQMFTQDSTLVALGPKILRATMQAQEDGERSVQFSDEIECVGLAMGKSRHLLARGGGDEDRGQYHDLDRRTLPSPVCVAFRASFLHEQKERGGCLRDYLPETLSVIDLLWRAKLQAKGVLVLPDAVVWHHAHHHQPLDKNRKKAYKAWKGSEQDDVVSALFLLEIANGFVGFFFLHLGWLFLGAVRFFGQMILQPSKFKRWMAGLRSLSRAITWRFRDKKDWKVSFGAVRTWFV